MLEQHRRRPKVTSRPWTTAHKKSALGLLSSAPSCAGDSAICCVVTVSWRRCVGRQLCCHVTRVKKWSETATQHTTHHTPHTQLPHPPHHHTTNTTSSLFPLHPPPPLPPTPSQPNPTQPTPPHPTPPHPHPTPPHTPHLHNLFMQKPRGTECNAACSTRVTS